MREGHLKSLDKRQACKKFTTVTGYNTITST